MKFPRITHRSQRGFTLIEIIVTIVVGAIVGMMFLSYMGTQLTHSGDPITIARNEGVTEMWMERITSDYVKLMNTPVVYTTALATIFSRDYTLPPYSMPGSVILTRSYITYDAAGNEIAVTGGGTSTNLKVTIQAGGYGLTAVVTAQRTTDGDPIAYY